MTRIRTISAIATQVVALLVVIASAGATTQQTRNYGGFDEVSCATSLSEWANSGLTAVCFDLDGSENTASIAVVDETSDPIVAIYTFYDGEGSAIDSDRFCNGVVIGVPDGASSLQVSVRTPSLAGLGNACGKPVSPATRGVVTLGLS